jgi:hypothetical protein
MLGNDYEREEKQKISSHSQFFLIKSLGTKLSILLMATENMGYSKKHFKEREIISA